MYLIWRSQSETNLYAGGSPPHDISGELPKNTSHLMKPSPDNRRISTGSMPIYETRLPKLTQESFGMCSNWVKNEGYMWRMSKQKFAPLFDTIRNQTFKIDRRRVYFVIYFQVLIEFVIGFTCNLW